MRTPATKPQRFQRRRRSSRWIWRTAFSAGMPVTPMLPKSGSAEERTSLWSVIASQSSPRALRDTAASDSEAALFVAAVTGVSEDQRRTLELLRRVRVIEETVEPQVPGRDGDVNRDRRQTCSHTQRRGHPNTHPRALHQPGGNRQGDSEREKQPERPAAVGEPEPPGKVLERLPRHDDESVERDRRAAAGEYVMMRARFVPSISSPPAV